MSVCFELEMRVSIGVVEAKEEGHTMAWDRLCALITRPIYFLEEKRVS